MAPINLTTAILLFTALVGTVDSRACRAVPGSIDWPSQSTWKALNDSLGGRLLKPQPPGAVCHRSEPTYNTTACAALQTAWTKYDIHLADPVSTMWSQFSNDTCLPRDGLPCGPEGYPVYVVNASSAHHVKLGMDFARQNNIRLVVKSTGHDYVGRSSGSFSLSIWTRYINSVHPIDSFRPRCCSDATTYGPAVTMGAGTQMKEAYEATERNNRTIVGGACETVSVGGYLTGGGHSVLAPRYGLASDQVLEMELVTPAGEMVTANECQNSRLFWAMRGGGGSTFGVIISITVKTFPSPPVVGLNFSVALPPSMLDTQADIVTYILGQYPYLSSMNISGYNYIYRSYEVPFRNGTVEVALVYGTFLMQDTVNLSTISTVFAPLFANITKSWPFAAVNVKTSAFPSLRLWIAENQDPNPVGIDQYIGSRLLDGPALSNTTPAFRDSILQLISVGTAVAFLVGGKGVWEAAPAGGGNAVLPAWRRAYAQILNGVRFSPLNKTAETEAVKSLNRSLDGIRKLSPDSGAYVNEANPYEPDWQHTFWGKNYEALAAIKRELDPHDVLWCHPCVGNEGWELVDGVLCKVDY
ncbi:FAD-binding domain-containing protein [Thozetella sp. PMI_491]|nr:FAD-binding domain-containing protein [Thozetella sp. PMI_491]